MIYNLVTKDIFIKKTYAKFIKRRKSETIRQYVVQISKDVRQIRAKNFEVSLEDQQKINFIESRMRQLYSDTQRLFI